eukprot:CAMPEP_0185160122 /NCGR_PEP_ID=MMETSP1139-20130426/3456_1 /TAXON_ID=298111 /ORGANISM="Pavlova sp., Strain CCMP459" /LENGTH=103 /DNA_ID=CAMNT_0027725315 /DNA_START=557 /DNA_END=869 /DNA_ORIENTATION=+
MVGRWARPWAFGFKAELLTAIAAKSDAHVQRISAEFGRVREANLGAGKPSLLMRKVSSLTSWDRASHWKVNGLSKDGSVKLTAVPLAAMAACFTAAPAVIPMM